MVIGMGAGAVSGLVPPKLDAAWRLGARPVGLWLADRTLRVAGVARRRLADAPMPHGRFLPRHAPKAPPLPADAMARVLAAARRTDAADWHRGFDPAAHALDFRLHQHGGARPAWEASRLAALPLLAQAARLDPAGGHLGRAESLLAGWCAEHPPFRGVAWACGQEAAFRALHLALALALLDGDSAPPPGARTLLERCAQRIAATPFYALAQDNNHPVSEAAGAFACALLLGQDTQACARRLAQRVARLVAPDGGFAQVSPGYARLLLDTLSVAEWLRRRHGAPAFPAPLAQRAAALAAWLHQLTDPSDGGTPPLGVADDSAFADLSLCGPHDARGSVERAARLFAAAGADLPADPGCTWLGIARPDATLPRAERWRAAGTMGWRSGRTAAVLRRGPLRFRPSQADLLHVSLYDSAGWLIRDGGTGSYDPPAAWWWTALAGAAGHNAPVFDGAEPMPRVGRFLLARWPRLGDAPEGATLHDAAGRRVTRRLRCDAAGWEVADTLEGRFASVAWHWRLRDEGWVARRDGVDSPATRLVVTADAPFRCALVEGWESPAYGAIRSAPTLRVEAGSALRRMMLRILPAGGCA
jgi:hypothetical protein